MHAWATTIAAVACTLAARACAVDLLRDYDSSLAPPASSAGSSGDAAASDAWHYRWHRGGAWMYHESIHPCVAANSSCELLASATAASQVAAELHVNTTIVAHMASVRVSYDLGAHSPSPGDFLGVYCVDEEDETRPTRGAPDALSDLFDYAFVHDVGGSTGSIVFGPLVNQRCSYQVQYLRHIRERVYAVIGASAHIEMERGPSEPTGIHLALTHTPSEMRVMWVSGRASHVHVHYGAGSPANVTARHAHATTATYAASDMCGAPATTASAQYFRHPGYIHDAVLTDLVPGETYYYRVGSRDGVTSDTLSFTCPPVAGAASGVQSFIVFGDLGSNVLAPLARGAAPDRHFASRGFTSRPAKPFAPETVMAHIAQDLADADGSDYLAVVHVGDLSYARGRTFLWDQFSAMVAPVASRLPYMVAIGNHEYDYWSGGDAHDVSGAGATNGWHPPSGNYGNDSSGECGVPAAKRFHMPETGNQLFWYSFAVGLTHHVVISSEHDVRPASPMREWLERELARVDRAKTPWLLLHIHRPLYASEKYEADHTVTQLLRDELERVLLEHRVDVVFSGHYHAYERTCPVYQAQCRHKTLASGAELALAPVHIMVGSGGAALDDAAYFAALWSKHREQAYGHGRLHVHNATHALWEFVRAHDRVVSDRKWLVSNHDWSYQRGE